MRSRVSVELHASISTLTCKIKGAELLCEKTISDRVDPDFAHHVVANQKVIDKV